MGFEFIEIDDNMIPTEKGYPTAPANELAGQEVEMYVKIAAVRFPKNTPVDEIVPGSFAIIGLSLVSLEKGVLPEELNKGTLSRQSFPLMWTKGRVPKLEFGVSYYFRGFIIDDPQWGPQFETQEIHKMYNMKTKTEKETFLRVVFSPSRAQKLIENFDDPLQVLANEDVAALCKVKGIAETTALEMINEYKRNIGDADGLVQLAKYNLTQTQIDNMLDFYKSIDTVVWLLENDPYAFIATIRGIGWERADTIGINNGMSPISAQRIAAFVHHYLETQAQNIGHLWVELPELAAAIDGIAPLLPPLDLKRMLNTWSGRTEDFAENPWLYYDETTNRIGLMYYRKMEEQIAWHLMRLQQAKVKRYDDEEIEDAIERTELECGFEYTEEQKQAMRLCFNNNVICITGSSGTGKTTTVRPVVNALVHGKKSFCQCALSGKASSNLEEVTGQKGQTIHRLLGWNTGSKSFMCHEGSPLHTDMVIVDEISMIEDGLFLSLLKAIPTGAKLVLLGDIQQLEAIGPGAVALDMLQSPLIPSKMLTKIHRQAAASGIISESIKASNGEHIVGNLPITEIRGDLHDMKIRTYSDSILTADNIMEEYINLREQGITPKDLAVLVPMKERGEASCYKLNNRIQELVNPPCPGLPEIKTGSDEKSYILRKYDKIVINTNHYRDCYDMSVDVTAKNIPTDRSIPIYNGNTGFIVDIGKKYITVDLTIQGKIQIPKQYWKDIGLGYALTAHRYQGSASPYVIVGIDSTAYNLLCKEWLYTAITRAKKYCVLVGQISAVRQSVATSRVLHKHTWLRDLLSEAYEEYKVYTEQSDEKARENKFTTVLTLSAYRYWPDAVRQAETKFQTSFKMGDIDE